MRKLNVVLLALLAVPVSSMAFKLKCTQYDTTADGTGKSDCKDLAKKTSAQPTSTSTSPSKPDINSGFNDRIGGGATSFIMPTVIPGWSHMNDGLLYPPPPPPANLGQTDDSGTLALGSKNPLIHIDSAELAKIINDALNPKPPRMSPHQRANLNIQLITEQHEAITKNWYEAIYSATAKGAAEYNPSENEQAIKAYNKAIEAVMAVIDEQRKNELLLNLGADPNFIPTDGERADPLSEAVDSEGLDVDADSSSGAD